MALRDTPVGRLGRAVAQILSASVEENIRNREASWESIAANARVSTSHLRNMINGKRPINSDQLDLISASLGLIGSQVYERAEEMTAGRPRNPATYPTAAEILQEGF